MSKSNYQIGNFTPLTTLKHTCGDTAEDLDDVTGFVAQSGGSNVVRVTVSCEDHDIRFAWGVVPTQAGVGHVLTAGSSLVLTGYKIVVGFGFINKTNGDDAVLQLTPELSV